MKNFLLATACAFVAGCSPVGPVHDPELEAATLPWIIDGVTTKEEALLTLGAPSARFQGETILTWRLGRNADGELKVFAPEVNARDPGVRIWDVAQFSLVLVFDDSGVLARHRLLRI